VIPLRGVTVGARSFMPADAMLAIPIEELSHAA